MDKNLIVKFSKSELSPPLNGIIKFECSKITRSTSLNFDIKTSKEPMSLETVITTSAEQNIENLNKTENISEGKNLTQIIKMEKDNVKFINWESVEKNGDICDWLKSCRFLVDLNKGSLSDAQIIQKILSAIRCVEIRSKIIDELEQVAAGDGKLEKFSEIFKSITSKDTVTYSKYLKNLRYTPELSMREFYGSIYRLISKSMDLDVNQDKKTLTRLSTAEFIGKIPKRISTQMQNIRLDQGTLAAEEAERIRSFQKLFLDTQDNEVNQLSTQVSHLNLRKPERNNVEFSRNNRFPRQNSRFASVRKCFNCQSTTHLANACRNKSSYRPDSHFRGNNFRGNNFRGNNHQRNFNRDTFQSQRVNQFSNNQRRDFNNFENESFQNNFDMTQKGKNPLFENPL